MISLLPSDAAIGNNLPLYVHRQSVNQNENIAELQPLFVVPVVAINPVPFSQSIVAALQNE